MTAATARPDAAAPRTHLLGVAEVCLLAVHLSIVVGFARLYRGHGFAGPMAAFAVVPWVVAVVARRRRVPAPVIALAGAAVAVLIVTDGLFRATARWGLPTTRTWTAIGDAVRDARVQFPRVVAPTAARPGFQLVAGLALLGSVWFADWAAFRLRATVESVSPAAVLFVFGALLGSGHYRGPATLTFVGSVLAFAAAHRAWRSQLDQPWMASSPTAGPWSVARSGAVVAVLALGVGAVGGPHLPGAHAAPVVPWRRHDGGNSSRVTVSPMVELRKRLVDQSDTELFTVITNRPAYWRLTSLDRFDGQIWSSSGEFTPAGERLPGTAKGLVGDRIVTQQVQIEALSAIWVPAAYQARGVPRSSEPLRWDSGSSTLIVDSKVPSSNGLTYTVTSEVPDLSPLTLSAASHPDDPAIAQRYEGLPADFPTLAARAAATATRGARNRYEQARMLQDWFRTRFTYSLATAAGHGDDALLEFLASRRGYCEQFAGAYAAMARSLGIPARVAVGFTPGEVDGADPTEFHVLGRHAHAWPEVWFQGVGWVPFEPTPGRGIPDASTYTGVAATQDPTRPLNTLPQITPQVSAPRGSTSIPSVSRPSTSVAARVVGGSGSPGHPGPGPSSPVPAWLTGLMVGGAIVLFGLLMLLAAPRARRAFRRRDHHSDPVLAVWRDTLDPVRWATGQRPAPAETHREFASRVAEPLGAAGSPFLQLANVVTATVWSPGSTPDTAASLAQDLGAEVRRGVAGQESRGHRFLRRLSWHEAFART